MRKPLRYVRPGSLAIIGAVVAAVLMLAALLESRHTRATLLSLLAEKGRIAASQIEQGARLALRATEEAESSLAERLLTVARATARLEELRPLDARDLARLAGENHVRRIDLVSADGRIQASSTPSDPVEDGALPDLPEAFPALLSGRRAESVLGLHFGPQQRDARFFVGVARKKGGIVLCGMDAERLLELRKTFGLGRLIQDVGRVHGIRYVMIQDDGGILAATPNISGARRVLDDAFLARLWREGGEATRSLSFGGGEVLEVVKAVTVRGEPLGLLRVAFDLHEVRALERRSLRRLLMTALVLAILGVVTLNAVVIYQNMNLVVRARDQVSTFSGAVLSGMADGVVVLSDDGRVSLANDAARAMLGTPLDRLPAPLRPVAEAARRRERPVVREMALRAGEATERSMTVSASRVAVPGEDVPYTVLILRDVTEERRLRDRVQRSEKITAMGRLAAAVAHEVRNPLNAIGMTAQRLRAEFEPREDTEGYRRFLDVIRSEIARLDEIITQFLRFAREPRVDPGHEDIGQLAASVVTQLEGQAAQEGVRLASDVPAGTTAWMDARQIRQVLLNLVANAIDATRGGGEVRIGAAPEGSWFCITVEDDGPGMTEEEVEKAFELHVTTKEKGTGLGLPICQRIVERHGGSLTLESRKGRGTKATIRLPVEGAQP